MDILQTLREPSFRSEKLFYCSNLLNSSILEMNEDLAVTKFREYLRIRTNQPNPDYENCVKFLFALADELGLEKARYEPVKGYPFVVMSIPGEDPQLPSLLLHSHTDVVPVYQEQWTHDPFAGDKDEKGDIYGRGSQDMKCNGIQYFEAIRRQFAGGKKQFKRTIHIIWGPDEERGSLNGMEKFVETEEFQRLNVGFVLDEGMASEDDIYRVYYGERCKWWMKVSFTGRPGHGSRILDDSAAEKMVSFLNSISKFREAQKAILDSDSGKTLGDVITVNLTMIKGGVETNVVPANFECAEPNPHRLNAASAPDHSANASLPGSSRSAILRAGRLQPNQAPPFNVF